MRGEQDEAERLFRANLARLDAEAAGAAGGPLAGGAALSTDAVEALTFIAQRCKVCCVAICMVLCLLRLAQRCKVCCVALCMVLCLLRLAQRCKVCFRVI